MKARLRYSCDEKWEDMTPSGKGRSCARCDHEVLDLTSFSGPELIRLLQENQGHVCGRVHVGQVNRHYQLPEVFLPSTSLSITSSSKLFRFIAAGSVLIASCGTPGTTPVPEAAIPQDTARIKHGEDFKDETEPVADLRSEESDGKKENLQRITLDRLDFPVCGGIDIDTLDNGIIDHLHPTVVAEFPGGLDSLASFVKGHLRYPAWEKEQGISGRVVALFIVEADGSISDPRIIQDVRGAKNFGPEVLRVIGLMPPWSPALLEDRPVGTQLSLPVSFSL